MKQLSYFFFLLFTLVACSEPPPEPKTPEEVVRQYQAYLDQNEFDAAKALSTPDGIQLLDGLKSIFAGTPADSSIVNTVFLQIACQENLDTARCICQMKDEYETYTSAYKLLRVEGDWLVDIPEEEELFENSEEPFSSPDTLQ